jgi:HEAT repeat protein
MKNHMLVSMSIICGLTLSVSAEESTNKPSIGVTVFQSLDSKERLDRLQSLAIMPPEDFDSAMFPMLDAGLADSDVKVRREAVFVLSQMAIWNLHAGEANIKINANIEAYPSLKEKLWKSISDDDQEVRQYSILAIFYAYQVDSEFYEFLVMRYNKEPVGKIRALMLSILADGGHRSCELDKIVVSALTDKNTEVQGMAAKVAVNCTPTDALPLLAQGMESSDLFVKFNCVRAIAAYGNVANKYIPDLEKLLRNTTNKYDRVNIEMAINQISEK